MQQDLLLRYIYQPEVQQIILGQSVDVLGTFFIGAILDPSHPEDALAILVRVPGNDISGIRHSIVLEGERIPIIVRGGFQPV